jgi:hypothetical protein
VTKQFSFPGLDGPVSFDTHADYEEVRAWVFRGGPRFGEAYDAWVSRGGPLEQETYSVTITKEAAQRTVDCALEVLCADLSSETVVLTRALRAVYPSLVIDNATMVELDKVVRS